MAPFIQSGVMQESAYQWKLHSLEQRRQKRTYISNQQPEHFSKSKVYDKKQKAIERVNKVRLGVSLAELDFYVNFKPIWFNVVLYVLNLDSTFVLHAKLGTFYFSMHHSTQMETNWIVIQNAWHINTKPICLCQCTAVMCSKASFTMH